MSRNICLIPARKGSQRFKDKNLALINGKTLVEISVEQALAANIFSDIYVSSDHSKILKIAEKYSGVSVHERKKEDAGASDTLIKFIQSFIHQLGLAEEDTITLLLVTAPLRTSPDILKAFKLFESKIIKSSVVSVVENEYPMELLWEKNNGHLDYLFDVALKTTRKQDYRKTFKFNDAIVIDSAENFLIAGRNLFGFSPIPYVMPPERSLYIDYEWQFKLIKELLKS